MISVQDLKIEEDFYRDIIVFLEKERGLNLKIYRKNFIKRRIETRMLHLNCDTYESYYNYILTNPDDEIGKFKDFFNINYSYFFRNWEIFNQFQEFFLNCLEYNDKNLENNLMPELGRALKIKKICNYKKHQENDNKDVKENQTLYEGLNKNQENNVTLNNYNSSAKRNLIEKSFLLQTSLYNKIKYSKNKIRIWSCACASGEEPYSIAMILDNLKKQIINFPDYKIIASDIDSDALKKAAKGIYTDTDDSMKYISTSFEKKYFSKEKDVHGKKYLLSDQVKNQVEFINEDVTKCHEYSWKYDIIFCRYLLIYINRTNRHQFINIIEEHLEEGGLLFLGKTESLFNTFKNFKLVDPKNHIYLKKI
ncbi:MAG: CheR family methyltransferase [Promethearchaeota archaeon]